MERFTRRRVAPIAQALQAEITVRVTKGKKAIEIRYEECDDLEFLKGPLGGLLAAPVRRLFSSFA